MKKISFHVKNNLIVRHKGGDYFNKDMDLFREHCPGHTLNNELTRANKFSYARLDGLMLGVLLDYISIDEILENRTKGKQSEPEPRTEADIKNLLAEHLELDERDLEALSEIIPLWLQKTDEEIIFAVEKLLGERTIQSEGSGEGKQNDGAEESNEKGENSLPDGQNVQEAANANIDTAPIQPIERDNAKKFQQRITKAETAKEVEAILKEDKEGGERISVQRAGIDRIDVLKEPQGEADGKKKD